jgi:hypothetical protein
MLARPWRSRRTARFPQKKFNGDFSNLIPAAREKVNGGYRCSVYGCTFTNPSICFGRAVKGYETCKACTGLRERSKNQ